MTPHGRRSTVRAGLVLAIAAVALLGTPVEPALALMTESETVPATFSTETLDAPTNLAAANGLLLKANLSWTATVDVRATGYLVFRGTTSGGPYTQVATVTSTSTTTYQDTVPLPGLYYYVLKTYIGSWTSPNGNQASVLVT